MEKEKNTMYTEIKKKQKHKARDILFYWTEYKAVFLFLING